MSFEITHPPELPFPRLLTAADLAVFPDSLPSGDVSYELVAGSLRIQAPADAWHGACLTKVAMELYSQGERQGHGIARIRVGTILQRDPDTVYAPDALFLMNRSLPVETSPEDYWATLPDLVVEVLGRNDNRAELERKAADYRQAGVKVVWVADPFAKTIAIHRPAVAPQVLCEVDVLTADEIIPGFQVSVAELFRV